LEKCEYCGADAILRFNNTPICWECDQEGRSPSLPSAENPETDEPPKVVQPSLLPSTAERIDWATEPGKSGGFKLLSANPIEKDDVIFELATPRAGNS